MANEFVARNGIIALNNSTVTGSLDVTTRVTSPSFTGSLYGTASNVQGGSQYSVPVWTGASTLGTSSLYESASVLKSVYGGNDIGLKLDFANKIYSLGEYNSGNFTNITVYDNTQQIAIDAINEIYIGDNSAVQNATNLYISDANQVISSKVSGNDIGLRLDFANDLYQLGNTDFFNIQVNNAAKSIELGDINGNFNSSFLQIADGTKTIQTFLGSGQNGLYLVGDNVYSIGQLNNGNITNFVIDDINQIIYSSNQNNQIGLKLDFSSSKYELGQLTGGNQTKLTIDDATQTISITGSVAVTGLSAGTGSSHVIMYNTASGQFFFTGSSAIGGGNASNDNFQQIFLLMGG